MRGKAFIGFAIIALVGILPVMLLFLFGPRDFSSTTHTLGQVAGLAGMTLFAVTFILSTRARWVESLFGGLDRVYPVHSIIGATSLSLLLAHPLLLVMKYIPADISIAARYLLPGGKLSVDFGIFALAGMIALLLTTLYWNIAYHRWKFSHEFLGVVFILAALHVLLIRDVSRDYIFQGYNAYAVVVSIVGIAGFAYSLFRNRLRRKKYVVEMVNKLNSCSEILLRPAGKGINFHPGQFVFVKFYSKFVSRESHPFSIASADRGKIRLVIKNLGDFTGKVGNIKSGDIAALEGPYGRFHENKYNDEVWIAGGIGITPFLALAEDFSTKDSGKADLYYIVKDDAEFVHLEVLEKIARKNKNFRLFKWVTQKLGRITLADIEKNSPLVGKDFFLCGPESLKASMKEALSGKSIPAKSIHDERFMFK